MSGRMKLFIMFAGGYGFLAVLLGAFGAHSLERILPPEQMESFMTGAEYQLVHAAVLLGVAMLMSRYEMTVLAGAGWAFIFGVAFFSGGLYLHALTDKAVFAFLAPVGGMGLMAGWIFVFAAAVIHARSSAMQNVRDRE